MRRVTRLKATMILHWDNVSAPLQEWPLEEGEVVEIPVARLGRRKQVLCGAVLACVGATCYLACHPDDVGEVLNFYQKRVWLEEQNRDVKRRDRRAEGGVEEPAIAGRRPGEAGDASRRKVIVGAVSHRVVVQRCGRRTNRGVITCRVMRVHFGVTMAEMHHEHSDTPMSLGFV